MNKIVKLYCKKGCSSAGGAMFFENKFYYSEVLGHAYYIKDKDGNIIRLEDNNDNKIINLHTYFYTESEVRKLKLQKIKKLNESW